MASPQPAQGQGPRLRVGILGGGALGLAAGLRLAQARRHVTVIEREPQLGGLAGGFRVGPSALEKFYHHIFRTDTAIIRLIEEMGLSDQLVWQSGNTSVRWQGRTAPLNTPLDFLRFPFVQPLDRLRWVAAMALLKAIPNERPFEGQTASAWIRRFMGDGVYEVVWRPLLRGKFAGRADEVAMTWFWSRVHERSFQLGYLRHGFQQFYDALGERICSLGGTVLTGTEVTAIRSEDGGVAVEVQGGQVQRFDQVLATLPTRLFERLTQGLPEDFARRYPGPDHYGAHVAILGLDRPLTSSYWLNLNEPDFPFLVLVEHTNFMPVQDYGEHLVYLGNYLPMDHPLFGKSDEQVKAEYLQALKRINPQFDSVWVKDFWVFKAPYAQPIVTRDYLRVLPPHKTPLPGVYLANMAHVYPQDRGQNYSLRLGERTAQLLMDERP